MGVLGALALVGLLVAIVVPLARLRRRQGAAARTRADEESVRHGSARLGSGSGPRSRRSSFRHQKNLFGPDALLPLVTPVSTFAWSDMRSRSPSCDDDSLDEAEVYSFPTAGATTSHLNMKEGREFPFGREAVDVRGRRGKDATRTSLPSPNRTPTPPGLPSKHGHEHGYAPAASTSLLATTTTHSAMGESSASEAALPLTPVSPIAPPSRNTSRVRPAMPPVMEDSPGSRPTSLQLPSPPSSPDQVQAHWRTHSSRRPTITASHSAPTTLPFRPRSSTVTSPSFSLTSAFRSPLAQSNTVLSTSSASPMSQRYPSFNTPSQHSRSRASSVSVDVGAFPQTYTPRPVDTSHRMSSSDIRHRHTSHQPHDPASSTVSLRHPDSLRTSRYLTPGSSAPHQYAQPEHTAPPTFTTPPPAPLSPPVQPITPPRLSTTYSRASDAPRAGPSTVTWRAGSAQQQPALVRRKDSLALRPIAPSFLHSPPQHSPAHSPPSGPSGRSRSGSIRSVRTVPAHIPPLEPLPPLQFDARYDASNKRSSKVSMAPDQPAS
ncbi:hypothetical protein OBBRIDRAFT_793871 [Obba rivulosa]|uniref:Uncharacterized protein n=1 Tax=Obba rivulosa TaxID=1052685 RepID=A0A8E2ARY7_9APHY|nr:hypothetical protein OBBRIDRAFT_793871 [Obba rivulosa]